MGLVFGGVRTGEAAMAVTGASVGARSPAAVAHMAQSREFLGFVDTRPVYGPSFAENGAYLRNMDAEESRKGLTRRERCDRPAKTSMGRIMTAMPEQFPLLASPAVIGRRERLTGGRSGL